MGKFQKLTMAMLFVIGLYGFLVSAWVAVDNIMRPATMGGILPDISMHLEPNALLKIRLWSLLGIVIGLFGWVSLFLLWRKQQLPLKEIQHWIIAGAVCLLLMYSFLPLWTTHIFDFSTPILCFWLLIKVARNKHNPASS
ncbi:MAG: hypothetical protein ACYC1F_02785 [Gallionellaceae bacterium]